MSFFKTKKKNANKSSILSTSESNTSTNDINQSEENTQEQSDYINMTGGEQQAYQQYEDDNNYRAPNLSPTAAPSDEYFTSPAKSTNNNEAQQQQEKDEGIPQSPSYEQTVSAATAFVNEQVGKVRQLAEEGPLSFRVLAFLGGVAMIVTSVLDWIGELFGFSMHKFLM